MKLITRDVDYSIRALLFISTQDDKRASVSQVSKALGVPRAFLRKSLQTLDKGGILRSTKGKGGGFVLSRPLEQIWVIDIMNILQGPFKLNECTLKKRHCPNIKNCALKKRIDRIEKYVSAELSSVNLADFLGKGPRP